MNTSEYPPDGIYFRNRPDWNNTSRVNGWGVFAGDLVQLECWDTGTNVPRRDGGSNTVWYMANNVTRPTAPGPRPNSGWINAHFVNDGTGPNQVAPGVPHCDANGRAPAPGGSSPPVIPAPPNVTAYFSPFGPDARVPQGSPNTANVFDSAWKNGRFSRSCDGTKAYNAAKTAANGRAITKLVGWSIGRVGPWYYLSKATEPERRAIANILSIDPGTYGELSGGCDRSVGAGQLISYLAQDPSHTFTVLAGDLTADTANRGPTGYAHRSIQEIYFNPLRDHDQANRTNLRGQVLVCNYTMPGVNPRNRQSLNLSHNTIFQGVDHLIGGPPITSCPTRVAGMTYQGSWRP